MAVDPVCGATSGDDSVATSSLPPAAEPSFGIELCGLPVTDCTKFGSDLFDEQFSAYGHVRMVQQDVEACDDVSLASCFSDDDSVSTNASLATLMAHEAALCSLDDDESDDEFDDYHLHRLSSTSVPSGPLLSSLSYDDVASSLLDSDDPFIPEELDALSPLDQLRRVCSLINRSAVDIYAEIRQDHNGIGINLRAHMDGGASASTTD